MEEYEVDYFVIYLSHCERIIITIKRGLRLLSISPKNILENKLVGKEIIFQNNGNLSGLNYIYLYN